MASETKGSSEPLLGGPSSSSILSSIVEDPKEAERRSKAIDAQLAAERRSAVGECTVWVTAPGNGIETLDRWLQSFVRVRTSVAPTPSQSNIDVPWNDVWSSAPPSHLPSSSSSNTLSSLSVSTTLPTASSTSTSTSPGVLLSAPNGEHRRSLSHGSAAAHVTSGASSPSSPIPTSAASPATHIRRLSGAFSSTALREGWIPIHGHHSSSGTTNTTHDDLAKFRIIATDWMGAAEMKKWLHQYVITHMLSYCCEADRIIIVLLLLGDRLTE
jgi:hypothetical protein